MTSCTCMVNIAYGFVAYECHIISTKIHNNFVTGTCTYSLQGPQCSITCPCMHVCSSPPQSLLNEISSHEPNIQAVTAKAKELMASDHFACDVIQQQDTELQQKWREAKLLASRRSQKLSEAVESQKVSSLVHTTTTTTGGSSICTCIVRRVWKFAYSRAVRISLCSSKLLRRHGST